MKTCSLDNPPYRADERLKRFSRKMTAFSRAQWDPTCIGYDGKRPKSPEEIIAQDKPGYSRVDYALQSASWTIASGMGHLAYSREKLKGARGTGKELAKLSKYEPPDVEIFTNRVKKAAKFYGASVVGVCKLDRRWLYATDDDSEVSGKDSVPLEMNNVIVIGIEMDWDGVMTAPTITSSAATGNGYSRMAVTAACLAEFLRDLGWQAIPSGNDTALSIPLAIDAGLGELGRNGLLINPQFGPRLRLCKVFTNAPLLYDQPILFGATRFCEICTKCADHCPSGSITKGERTTEATCLSNNPGVLKWPIHAEKCLRFWKINGSSCSNCIRSCPFNKPQGWIHNAARRVVELDSHLLDRALLRIDDLLRYGVQRDPIKDFWRTDNFIHHIG